MKPVIFCFFILFILLFSTNVAGLDGGGNKNQGIKLKNIGAILDCSSRIGKEEKIAMEMAIEDFYKNYTNTRSRLVLHIKDSQNNPMHAAFAAKELIDEKQVWAIVGARKWDETTFVAELSDKAQVPILSLAEGVPSWATQKWPFLVQAVRSQHSEMRAVAAIVGSWKWSRVNIIYEEDINSATTNSIPHLVDALGEVECKIDRLLPLPSIKLSSSSSSSFFTKELERLKEGQSRVFIVHISLATAVQLFMEAKNMGMMGEGFVWITTNALTSLLDSIDQSTMSSFMQGILGVRSYYQKIEERVKNFSSRFRSSFHLEFREETNLEPGISSLQAYDALWAVALAMEQETPKRKIMGYSPKDDHQNLLERIQGSNFMGLTGEFRFKEGRRFGATDIFQILNVNGNSYREMGFWSEGLGFFESINSTSEETHNPSMKTLGQVFWPGGPFVVPSGWVLLKNNNSLRIGVPGNPTFNQFVNVSYAQSGGNLSVEGLSIDVFKAALEYLPYKFPYDFIPYEGTYDSLLEQIYLKNFDAVIGDTSIVADRCDYAEFSLPWTDSGLQLVVYQNPVSSEKPWLFTKPFTKAMWGLTAAVNIYNGFVVWLIERKHKPEFKGSASNQLGTLTWLAFTTLISLQGYKLNSNLSRMAVVPWFFLALVITQSYTSNLSSMLTVPRLESSTVSVESLKKGNAKVGCDGGSFVVKYLVDVLGFHIDNIRTIASADDYPHALKSGQIKAAFLEVPYVRIFLAKYCQGFAVVGQTYKVGGFGFAFPKGSPMLPDISKAIMKVAESGKLLMLQNALVSSYNCSSSDSSDDDHSLGVPSYWGLFLITAGTSTFSLVVFIIRYIHNSETLEVLTNGLMNNNGQDLSKNQAGLNESLMFAPETDIQNHGQYSQENQDHDPDVDEKWMFAPEMSTQNHGGDLTQHTEHNGD